MNTMTDEEKRKAAHLVRVNLKAHEYHARSCGKYGWPKGEWWKCYEAERRWEPMTDDEIVRAMSVPAFATPDTPDRSRKLARRPGVAT